MSNVSTKVTVSKEVAEAIERFLDDRRTLGDERPEEVLMENHCDKRCDWGGYYEALNGFSTTDMMRALVNGYQVEQTPEEELREFYESFNSEIMEHVYARTAIRSTLALLGITIEGIND